MITLVDDQERPHARAAVLAYRDRVASAPALSRAARAVLASIMAVDTDVDQTHTVTPTSLASASGISRALAVRALRELVRLQILTDGLDDDYFVQWPELADRVGLGFAEPPHRRRVRMACLAERPSRDRARVLVCRRMHALATTSLLTPPARRVMRWMIERDRQNDHHGVMLDESQAARLPALGRLTDAISELMIERVIEGVSSTACDIGWQALAALLELVDDRTPSFGSSGFPSVRQMPIRRNELPTVAASPSLARARERGSSQKNGPARLVIARPTVRTPERSEHEEDSVSIAVA